MSNNFVDRLDKRIASRTLLKHPFYQAWQAGQLTMEDLRFYGTQYWHFEKEFPRFLSAVHSNCSDNETRLALLQNLWDEESGDRNHESLWIDFCSGIGLTFSEIETTTALPETLSLTDTYRETCSTNNFLDGLALIYSYESQAPSIMESKLEGLSNWFGIDNEATTRFFTVHKEIDVTHSTKERELLARHLTEQTFERTDKVTQSGLNAWWCFLDGVQRMRV